jgi:hypothetical protein
VPNTWNLVATIDRDQEAKTVVIHLEGKEPRLGLSLAGDTGLALLPASTWVVRVWSIKPTCG